MLTLLCSPTLSFSQPRNNILCFLVSEIIVSGFLPYVKVFGGIRFYIKAMNISILMVIFQQAEERMDVYIEDIENLFMNAVYNSSVAAFLTQKIFRRDGVSERFFSGSQ